MELKDNIERDPIGILPYRRPPLSGLYRLRYRPPAAVAAAGNSADAKKKALVTAYEGTVGASQVVSAQGETTLASPTVEELHRQLHEKLLQSLSLDEGTVDLFTLYSMCDAEPVPCTQCNLHIDATLQTCSYRLRETYTLSPTSGQNPTHEKSHLPDPDSDSKAENSSSSLLNQLQEGWHAFFFPMSECGRLKDNLLVCVNDTLMAGDVAGCDFDHDGVLCQLQEAGPDKNAFFPRAQLTVSPPAYVAAPFGQASSGQTAATPKRNTSNDSSLPQYHVKPLFYYIVSPVPTRSAKSSATAGRVAASEMTITVSWRSYPPAQFSSLRTRKMWKQKEKVFPLLYSYYCAPRAPDVFTCRAHFQANTKLRLVRSPNCQGAVQLASEVTDHAARVRVETVDHSPLEAHRHPKDYIFLIYFYFGDYTSLMEETSRFATVVLFAVFLILLWFFLTKDLVV